MASLDKVLWGFCHCPPLKRAPPLFRSQPTNGPQVTFWNPRDPRPNWLGYRKGSLWRCPPAGWNPFFLAFCFCCLWKSSKRMLGKVVTVVVFVNTVLSWGSHLSHTFNFQLVCLIAKFHLHFYNCLKPKCAGIDQINLKEPRVSRRTIHVIYNSSSHHFYQNQNSTV